MVKENILNNPFIEWFQSNKGKYSSKWNNYFNIYNRYLSKYIGQKVTIVEIGVSHGGSLDMLKDVFGEDARIIGIDINPETIKFENDQIEVYVGDVCDSTFLNSVIKDVGKIDILIDDGGHFMDQQKIVLDKLFPIIKDTGVFICEDVQTSYQHYYGGGLGYRFSFIEHVKKYIDIMHISYWKPKSSYLTLSNMLGGIHFYDSVVVIEKSFNDEIPQVIESGSQKLDSYLTKLMPGFFHRIYYKILMYRSLIVTSFFKI